MKKYNKEKSKGADKWDSILLAVSVMLLMANIVGMLGLWQGFSGSMLGIIAGVFLLVWSIGSIVKHGSGKE